MWKYKRQEAVDRMQTAAGQSGRARSCSRRPISCLLLSVACLLFAAGCRVDMQDQPRMKPYRSSPFFKDGLSSRPLVEGTVPRGWLRDDQEFFTGKKAGSAKQAGGPAQTATTANPISGSGQSTAAYPDDVEKFPFPVTKEILDRGASRYQIFCSVCHGPTGTGDGMIVRRGFRKPPSFFEPRLREAPVGHYFDVVTNGWGTMPSYAAQIPVQDRWAIIAYVRALELTRPAVAAPVTTPAKPTSGGQK